MRRATLRDSTYTAIFFKLFGQPRYKTLQFATKRSGLELFSVSSYPFLFLLFQSVLFSIFLHLLTLFFSLSVFVISFSSAFSFFLIYHMYFCYIFFLFILCLLVLNSNFLVFLLSLSLCPLSYVCLSFYCWHSLLSSYQSG